MGALIDVASRLLRWAASLSKGYSAWPADLPSPGHYGNELERYFGEKANLVFQKAVAFLLTHERAHAIYGHLKAVHFDDVSMDERLAMEKEADIAALDALLSHGLEDHEKSAEGWALVSVVLSSLYAERHPRQALVTGKHPALHHRLQYIIEALALRDPSYQYYFGFLSRLVLQQVFPDTLKPERQFEDWGDAFDDAIDRLDALVSGQGGY